MLPVFKPPSSFARSAYLHKLAQALWAAAGPAEQQPQPGAGKRDILCFFRGDVGKHRLPHYSRGIRQKLHTVRQAAVQHV